MSKTVRYYRSEDGTRPAEFWLHQLKDVVGRAKARARIKRAAQGNLGDHRSAGAGIVELRIDYGPGYRIYIGLQGAEIIVLLYGGDKSTQEKDIARAHEYWEDCKRRL